MILPSDILLGKILIVDDQAPNVVLLERVLRGAGYRFVTSTMRSDEVCELHLLNRYDLIILDLLMPAMDGFQVMEGLKEIEAGSYLPVLVITAQPEHKLRALKAGAMDFVSKPFELAEVLVRVRNMLEVRLLQRETRALYERVVAEQRVSERLLLGWLPPAIVARFERSAGGAAEGADGVILEGAAELSLVFAGIVEFTKFAEGANAAILAGALDALSARLELTDPNRARRDNDAIADAWLAAIGLSDTDANHTVHASRMAMDMLSSMDRFNAHSRFKLKVQIVLNSGGEERSSARYDL